MEFIWGYMPDDFFLIPTIQISCLKCDDCEEIHGFVFGVLWLWYSAAIAIY